MIDCFSIGIIKCPNLFEKDRNLSFEVFPILDAQIKILLKKDLQRMQIWEHRIILESLKMLHELYEEEVKLDGLGVLYNKLVKFIMLRFTSNRMKVTGQDVRLYLKVSRKYPWSYIVIGCLFAIDFATSFEYINTRMIFFFIGIIVFIGIMLISSLKDIGIDNLID